jgi:hypothetical protein
MLNVPVEFKIHPTLHPIRTEEGVEGSPLTEYWIQKLAEFYDVSLNNVCMMCGAKIEMQIMKNTGLCSENCRKERDHDWQPFRGGALAP